MLNKHINTGSLGTSDGTGESEAQKAALQRWDYPPILVTWC